MTMGSQNRGELGVKREIVEFESMISSVPPRLSHPIVEANLSLLPVKFFFLTNRPCAQI
jgi:hypothetical protein